MPAAGDPPARGANPEFPHAPEVVSLERTCPFVALTSAVKFDPVPPPFTGQVVNETDHIGLVVKLNP